MSIEGEAAAQAGTPADVTRFDGVRVPATDYHPVWLDSLAGDVTIEGSAMNGVAQGAEAVRSIVTCIRALYDSQQFTSAGRPTAHRRQGGSARPRLAEAVTFGYMSWLRLTRTEPPLRMLIRLDGVILSAAQIGPRSQAKFGWRPARAGGVFAG
jgi:hypothetical protein